MIFFRFFPVALLVCLGSFHANHALAGLLDFDDREKSLIESHGPWPPGPEKDPSNRVSGDSSAIELGRQLFFDAGLSIDGTMSCATCHDPKTALSDGLVTGFGRAKLPRNTPALFNLVYARWFGWGGGADSLWAQSLRPLLAPDEMATTADHLTNHLRHSDTLSCLYQKAFNHSLADDNAQMALVNAAKALAAFQETLVTDRTSFDTFRDALFNKNIEEAGKYPKEAQRGLKLFIGKGQCNLCHFGPQFTNGEFGDIGIPFLLGAGKIDKGRYAGVQKLKTSPYTLNGIFSDQSVESDGWKTRHVKLQHRNWGEFKIPSLRNVAQTAPYMHNGSLATLSDVVRHYSEIDEERLHVDGEKILKPLRLSAGESADLLAFLESLSAPLAQPISAKSTDLECKAAP